MKLLILCYEYPPIGGGGAKVVDGLTKELNELGLEVDLVTMGYNNLASRETRRNITIHRIKTLRRSASICPWYEMLFYVLTAFIFLMRLRASDYFINHTHFIFPDGILALLLKKIKGLPYIITAHGSDVPGYNPDRFKLLHVILRPLWKIIINNAEKIVTPSASLDTLIKKLHPSLKTILIPNGIDINKYSHSLTKEDKILVVTRMFERKGVQHFIRALSTVNSDFKVNIVGDGPYLEVLKRVAGNEKRIKFYGHLDNSSRELCDLYETSRIFVFTSEAENFPIVLLEAMIAGLGIITSANTGCAEVVGDSALLVNPKDTGSVKDALDALITNPELCRSLGKKARARAEELFSWRTVARKYIDLYNSNSEDTLIEFDPVKQK